MRHTSFGWRFRSRPPSQTDLDPTTPQSSSSLFRNVGEDSTDIQNQYQLTRFEEFHGQSCRPLPSGQHAAPTRGIPERGQVSGGTKVECIVCRNDIEAEIFPKSAPCVACAHPAEVCVSCLRRTIQTAVETGEFLSGISCPSANCSSKLDYFIVEKWADRITFERQENNPYASAF
jgi:hypothetical protein